MQNEPETPFDEWEPAKANISPEEYNAKAESLERAFDVAIDRRKETPDAKVPAVNHAEPWQEEWSAASNEWATLQQEKYVAFDLEEKFVMNLLSDNARLIQAIQNGEGVKAFADLNFPPAA